MAYLLFTLLGLLVIAILWALKGRRDDPPTVKHPEAEPLARPAAPAIIPARWDLPPELASFRRVEAFELQDDVHARLLARLSNIPRPPNGLHKLWSQAYLDNATADELTELILEEPAVAAKVLATVNSSLYGLARPVESVAQGIALLGVQSVRGICMQHMMSESLRPTDPALQPVFDRWWSASAIASQLGLKLGQRLGLQDPGAMVTKVVLSFLGHMVAMSLLPPQVTLTNASLGFLDRTRREQEALGLCAGELGCMLMAQWDMPAAIIEGVRAVDRILTTPPKQLDTQRGLRLALAYFSARVGEKLASGEWEDMEAAAPQLLQGVEFFHLQTHFMVHPRLKELAQDFQDPFFAAEMDGMLTAIRSA
jgi:HD-like signal output (HDOD) protein